MGRLPALLMAFLEALLELVANFSGEQPLQNFVGGELDEVFAFGSMLLLCGHSRDLPCQKSKR